MKYLVVKDLPSLPDKPFAIWRNIDMNRSFSVHRLYTGKTLALYDQAIVSGGNFVLGILLARYLGLEAYGHFNLLWMGVLFALSLQQAYLTQPLLSLYAGKKTEEQPAYLFHLFLLQSLLSVVVFLLACLAAGVLRVFGTGAYWVAFLPLTGAFSAVYLLQDFSRKIFFVKKAFHQPLLLDSMVYVPLVAVLPLLHHYGQLHLKSVLWVLMGTYSLPAGWALYQLFYKNTPGIPHPAELLKTVKQHYHYSIWLLGTSLLQWFSGNFFLIAAASVLGAVAVGALRMAQNMVGLCHVLFLAMENVVPAEAAQHFFKHGTVAMFAYLRRVSLLAGLPVIFLLGTLTVAAPRLIGALYGAEYQPYSYLVGLYSLLYLFVFAGYPMRFALRTLQFTSPIFVAYCLSSAVSVLLAFPAARAWGVEGILAGLLATQLLTLVVYAFFISRTRNAPDFPFGVDGSLREDKRGVGVSQ